MQEENFGSPDCEFPTWKHLLRQAGKPKEPDGVHNVRAHHSAIEWLTC
jgi:hypothetical protein